MPTVEEVDESSAPKIVSGTPGLMWPPGADDMHRESVWSVASKALDQKYLDCAPGSNNTTFVGHRRTTLVEKDMREGSAQ